MKGLYETPWKAQVIHESSPDIEWQTRRLIKPQPDSSLEYKGMIFNWNGKAQAEFETPFGHISPLMYHPLCPLGEVGDEVYIKETWAVHFMYDGLPPRLICEEGWTQGDSLWYRGCGDSPVTGDCVASQKGKWRPSLFLPADLARTLVTITDIRAQRVQDISEKDARAEGLVHNAFWDMWESPLHPGSLIDWYKTAFKQLWDSIHGEGAWERNDWVWKYSFIRRQNETTESHRDTSSY